MSLVGSFVQAQDGSWYYEPVVYDILREWFICWDDSDPIELVMRQSCCHSEGQILHRLKQAGWELKVIGKQARGGQRMFRTGKDDEMFGRPDHDFAPAKSFFLRQVSGAPKGEWLSGYKSQHRERPDRQGVYYPAGGL